MPKITGRMASELPGKFAFWAVFLGFNIAFFPMHFLGLNGMPRRIYTYDANLGWSLWNFVSTCGALLLGSGIFFIIVHLLVSLRRGRPAGRDPWHGRTLEWSLPSPPPEYNFETPPVVRARDVFWHDKHAATPPPEHPAAIDEREHGVHMPDQSWWPPVAALGLLVAGLGMVFKDVTQQAWGTWLHLPLLGAAILLFGVYMWALEGPGGYLIHPGPGSGGPSDREK